MMCSSLRTWTAWNSNNINMRGCKMIAASTYLYKVLMEHFHKFVAPFVSARKTIYLMKDKLLIERLVMLDADPMTIVPF